MEGIAALSEKYQAPVYVHCSETKKEVEECRERTGMTPVALWILWDFSVTAAACSTSPHG